MAWLTVDKVNQERVEVKEEEFIFHGNWMEVNKFVAKMYKHEPTQKIFYEDVPVVRERELPIYPFK